MFARFTAISGRLSWNRIAGGHELRAEKMRLVAEGLEMQNGNIRVRERSVNGKPATDGSIRLDEIKIDEIEEPIDDTDFRA